MDTPASVAAVMDRVGVWWGVAGGWAIDLWYMAKSTEPKNQSDFEMARLHLLPEARAWLKDALQITPPGHRWLHDLS